MSLNPSLIPVKKITSNQPRSSFSQDVLEQAAKAILEAEGTINPIVVRQVSLREFEVIEGHLEYYAAVRAREIDLGRGEMIDAIVVQPENEAAILEQICLLRSSKQTEPSIQSTSDSSAIEHRLNNLEKQIENQLGELNRKLVDLNQSRNSQQQMAELIHATVSAVMKEQLSTIVEQIVQAVGTSRKKAIVPVEELEERIKTEGYEKLTAVELKALAKGRGLTGYSGKRKAELITLIKRSAS